MTHVLSDETARWPSLGRSNALEIGRPAGVKVGQTVDGRDAWVVGYTPSHVVVTWTGVHDENARNGNAAIPCGVVECVDANCIWQYAR